MTLWFGGEACEEGVGYACEHGVFSWQVLCMSNAQQAHSHPCRGQSLGARPVPSLCQQTLQDPDHQFLDEAMKAGPLLRCAQCVRHCIGLLGKRIGARPLHAPSVVSRSQKQEYCTCSAMPRKQPGTVAELTFAGDRLRWGDATRRWRRCLIRTRPARPTSLV